MMEKTILMEHSLAAESDGKSSENNESEDVRYDVTVKKHTDWSHICNNS